ncbi:hypothetical protein [Bacillus songklensis]
MPKAPKTKKVHLLVANDNGNSEQALYVNGELIRQPNVYVRPTKKDFFRDIDAAKLVPTLLEEINVTISSKAIRRNRQYYIGKKAIKSEYTPKNMDLKIEKKYSSDLPIINTTGTLAVKAVQIYFEQYKEIPKELEVTVDMVTALPVKQWSPENSSTFSKRFTENQHIITVHINNVDVLVKLDFELVKVAPEGSPSLFALIDDGNGNYRNDDIFEDFNKLYGKKIDGQYIETKTVGHIDIGDGTTDFPITKGFNLEDSFVHGCNHGVGHAIDQAIAEFLNDDKKAVLTKVTRQKFSEYIKDETNQYHQDAVESLEAALENEADFIYDEFIKVLSAVDNEIDLVVVYGGGSIVMKEQFYPLLKELCDNLNKKLLWIPEKYAALMNVDGLKVILDTMLDDLKMEKV